MTTLIMVLVMAVGVIVNVLFENAFEVVASWQPSRPYSCGS